MTTKNQKLDILPAIPKNRIPGHRPDNFETVHNILTYSRILANQCERITYGAMGQDSRRVAAKDIGKLVALADILKDLSNGLDARQV